MSHYRFSHDSCRNLQKSKTLLDVKFPRTWQSYVDRDSALIFLGFVAAQTLISILPIGRLIDGPLLREGRNKFRLNGKSSSFFLAL